MKPGMKSSKVIDFRTRQPVEQDEPLLTEAEMEEQRSETLAHLEARFMETAKRVRGDLWRIEPEVVASALTPESRPVAYVLIAETRAWLDAFESAVHQAEVRAV